MLQVKDRHGLAEMMTRLPGALLQEDGSVCLFPAWCSLVVGILVVNCQLELGDKPQLSVDLRRVVNSQHQGQAYSGECKWIDVKDAHSGGT